jgi:hypothetical protein
MDNFYQRLNVPCIPVQRHQCITPQLYHRSNLKQKRRRRRRLVQQALKDDTWILISNLCLAQSNTQSRWNCAAILSPWLHLRHQDAEDKLIWKRLLKKQMPHCRQLIIICRIGEERMGWTTCCHAYTTRNYKAIPHRMSLHLQGGLPRSRRGRYADRGADRSPSGVQCNHPSHGHGQGQPCCLLRL